MDSWTAPMPHLRIERGAVAGTREGLLAVEEPLEIRIQGKPVTVTMRTPGDDMDLAAGFLLTEGIVRHGRELGAIRHCATAEDRNVVDVTLVEGAVFDPARLQRNFLGNSSCGLCGKAAIDQIRTRAPALRDDMRVSPAVLARLGAALRGAQTGFEKTGGLHAAGIFDAEGALCILREDIGRHNAVDKAIGAMLLRDRVPLRGYVMMVSGRASFEIVQKALMASIPVLCAVSAPSSLAVDFAKECGMTLVGFLRGEEMNVYAGAERVTG